MGIPRWSAFGTPKCSKLGRGQTQGKGYQTRINAILREAMLRSLQDKA